MKIFFGLFDNLKSTDLHKGQVKGHFRKTATGKIIWVKEHFDARKKAEEYAKWKAKKDDIHEKHNTKIEKLGGFGDYEKRSKLNDKKFDELDKHDKKQPKIKSGSYIHRDDVSASILDDQGEVQEFSLTEMSQINDHDISKVLNRVLDWNDIFKMSGSDFEKVIKKYRKNGKVNYNDIQKAEDDIATLISKKLGIKNSDLGVDISRNVDGADINFSYGDGITLGEVLSLDWARDYYKAKADGYNDHSTKRGEIMLALEHYKDQVEISKRLIKNVEDMKNAMPKDCPEIPGLNPKYKLFTHQALALAQLSKVDEAMVDVDMGGGKSLLLAADAAIRLGNGTVKKPVICMPSGLIESHVEKFQDYFDGTIGVFVFDSKAAAKKDIKKQINNLPKNTIILASYSALSKNMANKGEESKFLNAKMLSESGVDMFTLDESHKIKNQSTGVNKAIVENFSHVKVKRASSGTLISNNPKDLIGQARFVNPSMLGSEGAFKEKYMEGVGKHAVWKDGSLKDLRNDLLNMGMISLRRSAWSYRMPPRQEKIHSVELPPKMKSAYKALLDSILDDPEVRKALDAAGKDNSDITSPSILAKLSHLETLIGAPEFTAEDDRRLDVHNEKYGDNGTVPLLSIAKKTADGIKSPKVAKVDEIITKHLKDKKNKKVIITCNTHEAKDYILKHMKHNNMAIAVGRTGRNATISEFKKNPDKKVLIAVRAGIKEGYDINEANRVISYDQPWNVGDAEQSYARIFRPGQTSKINIDVVGGNDTLEMTKYARLISKNHTNRQVTSDFDDGATLNTISMSEDNIKTFNQHHMMKDYEERANSITESEKAEGKIFTDKYGTKEYARSGKALGKKTKQTSAPEIISKPSTVKKEWHSSIPKTSKSKGTIIKTSSGKLFHIDGYDKEFSEWYGRQIDSKGSFVGGEVGFAPHENFSLHTGEKKVAQKKQAAKISKNWHSLVPTGAKSKGILIKNKSGATFHIDGYDKKHKEWYGRKLNTKGKPSGEEFGFGTTDAFSLVKTDLKKAVQVSNIFFMKFKKRA